MAAEPTRFARPLRAVLFDVGGPIDTEVISEAEKDRAIRAAMEAEGIEVSDAAYSAANDWAVAAFAPDTYASIIWRLASGDAQVAERAFAAFHGVEQTSVRGGIELRSGIRALVEALHSRGILLGLAANQPRRAVAELDSLGVGRYFAHREVSGHHGFRKPDVRLFLRALEDMEVERDECVMVGDRVDNDIVPAKLLGMRTVLFRTGRHIAQQPRSVQEIPDAEVRSAEELTAELLRITEPAEGPSSN
ncbi:MAG: HAD family hydrolase [Tepidiformaceae bacterium]